MNERPHTITNERQQIVGILHLPDTSDSRPAIVVLHGFGSNKAGNSYIQRTFARKLCNEGYVVYRFDFRGCGDSEGEFSELTLSSQISDANAALDMLSALPQVDSARLGILGRNVGGSVAACVAGSRDDIGALVLWSALADFEMFTSVLPDPALNPSPYPLEAEPVWPGFFVGKELVRELSEYDPLEEISSAQAAVLLVHGSEDSLVPMEHSERFEACITEAGCTVERFVLKGTAHSYVSAEEQKIVLDRTYSWFREHLPSGDAKTIRGATYAEAGIDIAAANRTKSRIVDLVQSTFGPEVMSELGSFGGLFAPDLTNIKQPVLVASTDSVGTKLAVAFLTGRHDTIGRCIVNHCVNDILVQGAKPLFFMDYIGIGRHDPEVVYDIVRGIADGCKEADCALLGGEMAELPGFYADGEYDLAGTVVGLVDKEDLIDVSRISVGDTVLGLASSGLHTNGYSLARRLLFEVAGYGPDEFLPELNCTVADELLKVHRCYAPALHPLCDKGLIKGMAHITGGGILENVPRILPEGMGARIDLESWTRSPIFDLLKKLGNIELGEAFRTFNMGIGMVVITETSLAGQISEELRSTGETVWEIGRVVSSQKRVELSGKY